MYNNTSERGIRNPAVGAGAVGQQPHSYGQSAASGPAPTTAGHHKHDILNKLDPRVDSTADKQPMSQTGSGVPEGTYGPHSSRIANALDPRVDSDLDSTRAAGAGYGAGAGAGVGRGPGVMHGAAGTGVAGSRNVPEGTYGPHSSRVANAMDPRVDSDRDRHLGPGATHAPGVAMGGRTTAAAPGVAAGTTTTTGGAGPHNSKLLNKLDPRVDSTTGASTGTAGRGTGAGAGMTGTGTTRGTGYY